MVKLTKRGLKRCVSQVVLSETNSDINDNIMKSKRGCRKIVSQVVLFTGDNVANDNVNNRWLAEK